MLSRLLTRETLSFAQFFIKNSKYLVPAPPPKRTKANAFMMFSDVMRPTMKDSKLSATEISSQISKQWNADEKARKEYEEKARQLNEEPERLQKEYEEKYEIPFKRITARNLMMAHFSKIVKVPAVEGQKADIGIRNRAVQDEIKKLTEAEKKKFEVEAEKITKEREKQIAKLEIPPQEYTSERAYVQWNSPARESERKKMTQDDKDKLKDDYKAYLASWRKSVEDWLKGRNIDMTLAQLEQMVKEHKEMPKEEKVKNDKKQIAELQKKLELLSAERDGLLQQQQALKQ